MTRKELIRMLLGIISNVASGEDRGNIEAVRSMVAEHIKGNTLILLTITMRGELYLGVFSGEWHAHYEDR